MVGANFSSGEGGREGLIIPDENPGRFPIRSWRGMNFCVTSP